MVAWFDKRISQRKLDTMDAKIIRRYGKVKVIREKDIPIADETDSVVDETSQIIDDLKREVIDYDEKHEYETIEPEKEKDNS